MKMFNVLISNSDDTQRENYCNYLSSQNNQKFLNIIGTNSGIKTLNAYNSIKPTVLVMDTKFNDITSAEILNRLSSTRNESKICNVILTTNNANIYPISNVEKIYKILYKNFDYSELSIAVNDICFNNHLAELNQNDLENLLLNLRLNITSPCTKLLIEAIYQCYYYPSLLENLDNITKIIAYKFNKSEKIVKCSFRNALRPINIYRNNIDDPLFIKLFDEMRNITPKYFLEMITIYLHKQNKK